MYANPHFLCVASPLSLFPEIKEKIQTTLSYRSLRFHLCLLQYLRPHHALDSELAEEILVPESKGAEKGGLRDFCLRRQHGADLS